MVQICPRCKSGRHSSHSRDFKDLEGNLWLCRCPRCTVDTRLPGSQSCSRTWVRDPVPLLSREPFHWFGDGLIFETKGPAKCGATPADGGNKWVDVVRTKRPKRICAACIEVKRKLDDEILNPPRKVGTGIPENAVIMRNALGNETIYIPEDPEMEAAERKAYFSDDPEEGSKWP